MDLRSIQGHAASIPRRSSPPGTGDPRERGTRTLFQSPIFTRGPNPPFEGAADYQLYLAIAAETFVAGGVEIWACCLTPNHVRLIAAPARAEALAQAVGARHVRYTRAVNRRERWAGYLWLGRFASFPIDEDYLRQCAR